MKKGIKVIGFISSLIISLILSVIFSISAGAAAFADTEPARIRGENGDEYFFYKGEQADTADLSAFMSSAQETVDDTDVTFMGTCDGYYYAAWTNGTEYFSLRVNRSMTLDEFTELLRTYM